MLCLTMMIGIVAVTGVAGVELREGSFSGPCSTGKAPGELPVATFSASGVTDCVLACQSKVTCIGAGYSARDATCDHYMEDTVTCVASVPDYRYFAKENRECQNGGVWWTAGSRCNCTGHYTGTYCQRYPWDCSEYLSAGIIPEVEGFGQFWIQPQGVATPFLVKCYTNWGGYTYLMQREGHCGYMESFTRSWAEYRDGFGSVAGDCDFWLGLRRIHQITTQPGRSYKLDVTLRPQQPETGLPHDYYQAYYHPFQVGDEADGFRVTFSAFTPGNNDAGNSLDPADPSLSINGQRFSTYDVDNDGWAGSCAALYGAGWWYNNCTAALPTGRGGVRTPSGARNATSNAIFWLFDLAPYSIVDVDVKVTVL